MRIKHMIITGVALSTLIGCGTNNTQQANDRGWDNIEPVRNQPNQMQRQNTTYDGTYQHPGTTGRGGLDQNQQAPLDGRTPTDQVPREGLYDQQGNQGQYQVAEDIAEQVTSEVNEIDRANVLTMGNTAYVACQLDNNQGNGDNDDLSDRIERKVTEAVKDADNQIDQVFVSSNPDFVDLTSNYMNDVDRGEPIEGFFDQFGEMIERIFPTRDRSRNR
ncbi:YhcN/YlaJ family sporulation lipoprotein [Amphibacillus cookii]|uniref:YhcN/YlaJ family sporulation lipoprotein n=1 Tax=Amphibacillus cookii TaxID=767787 RepID=UPI001EF7EBFD|nr:YhcN/YlaJ family sporulation lipoprotein [Amphibacillus cookii]MBM7540064.1 YhcN/YlaJ family sporulation lipoprotein [Amphibacillus cookii]